jgi:hypothetical protein
MIVLFPKAQSEVIMADASFFLRSAPAIVEVMSEAAAARQREPMIESHIVEPSSFS